MVTNLDSSSVHENFILFIIYKHANMQNYLLDVREMFIVEVYKNFYAVF